MKRLLRWVTEPENPFNLAGVGGFAVGALVVAYRMMTALRATPEDAIFNIFMGLLAAVGGVVALLLFIGMCRGKGS